MTEKQKKVAVVTGASRGIGRAIALKLADLGYDVAFNYSKSKDKAESLVKEIKKNGAKVHSSCVDIKDFEGVKTWIAKVKEDMGSVDVLINNAGIIRDKALMMMTSEDWNEVIDTNLTGYFNASRACIVDFLKKKQGWIINISSVSGIIGLPRQTNYSATKGGINAFTKALAKEVAPYDIRVNAICPGFIETDILSDMTEEQIAEINSSVPLGRIGSVDDVTGCVEFLLSENAQYITGQLIQIDGGLAIR